MTVKILGLSRLELKLKLMPRGVKREIRSALEKSADEIVAFAKSLAPVRSGDLYESIGWTWGKAPKGSISLATATSGDLTITIYAGNDEAYYARWIEFGTQFMRAQPFFFPSYRALRRRVRGRVTRAINKAAKRQAAR